MAQDYWFKTTLLNSQQTKMIAVHLNFLFQESRDWHMLCSYPGHFLWTISPAHLLSDIHISQFCLHSQIHHSFRTRSTINRGSIKWATKHSLHWTQKWIHDLKSAGLVITNITKNCTGFLHILAWYCSPLLLLITPCMFLRSPSLI